MMIHTKVEKFRSKSYYNANNTFEDIAYAQPQSHQILIVESKYEYS